MPDNPLTGLRLKWPLFLSVAVLGSFLTLLVSAEGRSTPVKAFVSIPPQAFFVEQIGGDHVMIDTLLMPGKNHDTFTPSPDQVARLAKADLFFTIGLPYERSVVKKIETGFKNLRVVNTVEGISFRKIEGGHTHTHDHDHEASSLLSDREDGSVGNDPHTWLNPLLVITQAENILTALIAADPESRSFYTANFEAFTGKLKELDGMIHSLLEPVKGGVIFVFHPAYGYFTDAYGLKQMPVEIEGKSPKAKELASFIKQAKEHHVRALFVQKDSSHVAAKKIAAAVNGVVIEVNPLEKNYFGNLMAIAEAVSGALKKEPGEE